MSARPNGLFLLDKPALDQIYGPQEQAEIARLVTLVAPPQTASSIRQRPEILAGVDVLFSGWGGPHLDQDFLAAAPNLRAVFYGAGSAATILTEASWRRGVKVTTAYAANAVPVAEYALGCILLSLKHAWPLARQMREKRDLPERGPMPGACGSTVGLIALGMAGRKLGKLLQAFDVKVIAYDPLVSADEIRQLNVELVSLEALFRRADVISLQAPLLPETEGMVTGEMLDSMKTGSTFINTARGPIVREAEMLQVAARRPDLQFILDVTNCEPPASDSPLFVLPNVMLTPHISGSLGQECRRMGRCMVDELRRYLRGEPLQWLVTRELAAHTSHRPRPPQISVSEIPWKGASRASVVGAAKPLVNG